MRYFIILTGCATLFTGCITWNTLDRAKEDRKQERLKTVLTSYKDSSGNAVIVYKKRYRSDVYKAVIPLDTVLARYNATGKEDLFNRDSTLKNFKGVFTMQDAGNKKEQRRIVLFNNETPLTDTTGLHKEIKKNENIVQEHKGRTAIPVDGYAVAKENVKTKAVTFTVQTGNNEKYYIVFQPHRRKYVRYLLVPLTVGADAVTWPVQLVIGFIALSKVPIS